MEEQIILVDEKDNETGSMEKLKAHENGGTLHRAFSIFVFNIRGEMLIQKRAAGKYHCAGLWTIPAAATRIRGRPWKRRRTGS